MMQDSSGINKKMIVAIPDDGTGRTNFSPTARGPFPDAGHCGNINRLKTHERLKESFFIRRIKTKRAHFRGSPLFQATYKIKTEKRIIYSTYLVSVRCGKMAEGKGHETDRLVSYSAGVLSPVNHCGLYQGSLTDI